MTSLVINVIKLQLSSRSMKNIRSCIFVKILNVSNQYFSPIATQASLNVKKRNEMFVLIKAPQVALETMSSPEETMADSNSIYSTDNVASSHIPAASGIFIHGNAMTGAFWGLHH